MTIENRMSSAIEYNSRCVRVVILQTTMEVVANQSMGKNSLMKISL